MKTLTVILFGFVLFMFPHLILASEQIDAMDVTVSIEASGKTTIEELISYDFESQERHGIYRDIPFVTTNDSGKRFGIDFSNISVTDREGRAYPFVQSIEGDDMRLKIGDPERLVTGKHEYNISYTASGALTYFPGHDELYWNITGNKWDVQILKASATIYLPADVVKDDIHSDCFTGQQGSSAHDCSSAMIPPRTVEVQTKGILGINEGLTAVVGFPKGITAVLEPKEMVPFFDTFFGKIVLVLLGIAGFLWYIVAPIWVVRKWFVSGRDPKPAMGEVAAWFSPPKTMHKRNLSPAETGTLVDERADLRDIYASLVDLARRGYLKIIETKKNTFDLEKTKEWEGDKDVLPFERELLSGMFTTADRVSIKNVDMGKTLEKVKSMLYNTLVSEKFFPSNPNTLRSWYVALAVLSLIIFNPILFLVAIIFGQHMPKKTVFGAEQTAVARSLRNFLTSQDKQLAFQAKNQMMFEKLLAFAVAFGVERIWAERFQSLGIKNPDWYQSSTGSRFNSLVFANSLGRGMSSSFASSIAAHSSSGHSSGFSGGSSGGGGGGGGGGSW